MNNLDFRSNPVVAAGYDEPQLQGYSECRPLRAIIARFVDESSPEYKPAEFTFSKSGFISEANLLKNKLSEMLENQTNRFPIEVFPSRIQHLMTATNESLKYPLDFIGSSMLYTASVSIGNTHKVEVKKGWQENAVIFIALVGPSGTNKSHPISFALEPIEQRDKLQFKKYQNQKMEFETVSGLSKKEREQQGYDEPVKPIWEQQLVSDTTNEGIIDVLKYNKRGIGVYVDELASWFKNFNRYNSGSDEQFWLSVWSNKSIRINRKTSEPTYITTPFISVIGTIQPGVINELANNRKENGFLDRLLFVVPDNLKKEYWSENELSPEIETNWHSIISKLLDLQLISDESDNPHPTVLEYTPEAKELLFKWQKELTDESNNAENESTKGVNAKIEMYAIRLSLILQMMHYACGAEDKQNVGIVAVNGALKLAEYFKRTAGKIHQIIDNSDPEGKLSTDKRNVYNILPETFTTREGLAIAASVGMPERSFKRFLTDEELFNKTSRGQYEKQINQMAFGISGTNGTN